MAGLTPLMPFLRPRHLPRPSTIRNFVARFSSSPSNQLPARAKPSNRTPQPSYPTPPSRSSKRQNIANATRQRERNSARLIQPSRTSPTPSKSTRPRSKEDPNLIASRTASPSYPPPSLTSLPRPKVSRASRRTAHPTKSRPYPTRQPTHTPPTPRPYAWAETEPVELLSPERSAPNLPYFVTRTPSRNLPIYELSKRGGNKAVTRVKKVDGDVEALRDELRIVLGLDKAHCVVNAVNRHVMLKGHVKSAVQKFLRERRF